MSTQENGQKPPAVPEGAMFLVVALDPNTGAFICGYSTLMQGIALNEMAEDYLDITSRREIAQLFAPAVSPAGTALDPRLFENLKNFKKA